MPPAEATITCPACESSCTEWTTRDSRTYAKCSRCGAAHMINPPSPAELAALYRNTVFTLPGNERYYDDDATNLLAARARAKWVEARIDRGRLLDIGCGFGHFLSVLDRTRWDATGIDLSPHCVEQAKHRFGVICQVQPVEQLPRTWQRSFDVVTLWDVIEHVADPLATIRRAAAMLRAGGRLYLSTPDISAVVARVLGSHWHYLDPMQHLTLFSAEALRRLCRRAGLEPQRHRTFGRSYTMDYLLYRVGYSYPVPGLRGVTDVARRLLGPARELSIPIKLGDITALEAIGP